MNSKNNEPEGVEEKLGRALKKKASDDQANLFAQALCKIPCHALINEQISCNVKNPKAFFNTLLDRLCVGTRPVFITRKASWAAMPVVAGWPTPANLAYKRREVPLPEAQPHR